MAATHGVFAAAKMSQGLMPPEVLLLEPALATEPELPPELVEPAWAPAPLEPPPLVAPPDAAALPDAAEPPDPDALLGPVAAPDAPLGVPPEATVELPPELLDCAPPVAFASLEEAEHAAPAIESDAAKT